MFSSDRRKTAGISASQLSLKTALTRKHSKEFKPLQRTMLHYAMLKLRRNIKIRLITSRWQITSE